MVGSTSNSPAICKRCKNKVVSGVKCNICSNFFHASCAKLNNVIFIDDNNVKCCVDDSGSVSTRTDDNDALLYDALNEIADENNKVDIKLIKYILHQKDVMISELREKNDILTKYIDLLNVQPQVSSNKIETKTQSSVDKQAVRQDKQVNSVIENSCEITNNDEIRVNDKLFPFLPQHSKNGVHSKIQEQHLSSDSSSKQHNTWSDVVRRNTNRITIVGKKISKDNITPKLQGVPKYVPLHLYRLAPQTKCEDVIEFMKSSFPEVLVEQLNSRYPELYSSFKVSIYAENINLALDSTIWPENACVRRFLYSRKKTENQNE